MDGKLRQIGWLKFQIVLHVMQPQIKSAKILTIRSHSWTNSRPLLDILPVKSNSSQWTEEGATLMEAFAGLGALLRYPWS